MIGQIEKMHKMKLHEVLSITKGELNAVRVIGGWVYVTPTGIAFVPESCKKGEEHVCLSKKERDLLKRVLEQQEQQ